MLRRPTVLLSALVAGALAAGAAAPAAQAAEFITGVSDDKRYGKVTLTFSTDPGMMRLTLSKELAKTTARKDFRIECRTGGRYAYVASMRVLGNDMRRLSAPVAVPQKADRCLIRRTAWTSQETAGDGSDGTVVARMAMRRR